MATIHEVDASTVKQWLDNNEAVLIDVREVHEYENESIPTAKNIPLSTISAHDISPMEDKKIVVHCQAGVRSLKACEKLISDNFTQDLWNLSGGILAWKNANLPTKSSG